MLIGSFFKLFSYLTNSLTSNKILYGVMSEVILSIDQSGANLHNLIWACQR